MAVLGVTFSALTGVEAVLLDGLFSLIAFTMALISIAYGGTHHLLRVSLVRSSMLFRPSFCLVGL